ncbi:MAG: chemotaxis-specific protein-glutamate methyltransferase CheB [Acidimicrobiia bacterium]|nr:chemotaxis-specific protein-glutamate methyltransferase CheB [Acidimicrobiia bacterium]
MTGAEPVKALVVDDSTTARALLVAILGADAEIEVVGEAADGADAVAKVFELRPSVVVMDIEMPRVDGFEATKRIMTEAPTPIVIVTARHDPRDVAVTLQATQMGALTVLPKPSGPLSRGFEREAEGFRSLVKALADVRVVRRRPTTRRPPLPGPGDGRDRPIEAIGVGASTGGPAALFRFLGALPHGLDVPVLVVQHIATGFVAGLVRWLGTATPLAVVLAEDGASLVGGTVYVAPDGAHLEVTGRGRAALSPSPEIGGFRPSVSALFAALARAYGPRAAAVVLTGMGTDGLAGARQVRRRGGLVLAQDEETSTVFGMPKVVASAGLADLVGPVEDLAAELASRLGPHARRPPSPADGSGALRQRDAGATEGSLSSRTGSATVNRAPPPGASS